MLHAICVCFVLGHFHLREYSRCVQNRNRGKCVAGRAKSELLPLALVFEQQQKWKKIEGENRNMKKKWKKLYLIMLLTLLLLLLLLIFIGVVFCHRWYTTAKASLTLQQRSFHYNIDTSELSSTIWDGDQKEKKISINFLPSTYTLYSLLNSQYSTSESECYVQPQRNRNSSDIRVLYTALGLVLSVRYQARESPIYSTKSYGNRNWNT